MHSYTMIVSKKTEKSIKPIDLKKKSSVRFGFDFRNLKQKKPQPNRTGSVKGVLQIQKKCSLIFLTLACPAVLSKQVAPSTLAPSTLTIHTFTDLISFSSL